MKTKRYGRFALAALITIAFFVIVSSIGTMPLLVPFNPVEIQEPIAGDSDGEISAVIDSESGRILVLNKEQQLRSIIECPTFDSPIDDATDVCVSDGYIYVSGILHDQDTGTITKERVIAYDSYGRFLGVIYEVDGIDLDLPQITSMSDTPGGVLITFIPYGQTDSETQSIELFEEPEVRFIYMSLNVKDLAAAKYSTQKLAVASLALTGLVFLLFALNTSFIWACVVIVIIAILGKAANGWVSVLLETARKEDIPKGAAVSSILMSKSLAKIVQPFILGALLLMSDTMAVIIIGAVCIAGAGLFFILYKSQEPAAKEVTADDIMA